MKFSHQIQFDSRWFIYVATIFYLIVAYNSMGFHNPDEHFQIIEFASYKLGWSNRSDLAWEFNEQIRSGLQPAISYLVFKVLIFIGISDVYYFAFALRALTALLAITVINYFVRSTINQVKTENRCAYLFISFFLWFLPYINVRFSSESWSGLFFLLSLAVLFKITGKSIGRYLLLGALFGLSILFRFQAVLLVFGALLWIIFIAKSRVSIIFLIISSCFTILIIGVVIDFWLYGQLTITLYNYFFINIIQDVASQYGISPWYEIIRYIIEAPGPLGYLLLFGFFVLLWKQPSHILLWVSIPFLIVHSIIPHKEIRFLFPLANLCPLLLILSYQQIFSKIRFIQNKSIIVTTLILLIIINTCGLIVVSTISAGNTKTSITHYIRKSYDVSKTNVLFIEGFNPYSDWPFPVNTFYREEKLSLTSLNTIWQDNVDNKNKTDHINLLVLPNNEITGPKTISHLKTLGFVEIYQSIPWISQQIINFYDGSINNYNFHLYEFREQ